MLGSIPSAEHTFTDQALVQVCGKGEEDFVHT
jgi:hypothetical protein